MGAALRVLQPSLSRSSAAVLSGCQLRITKAAGVLKRKVNTTDRQKQTDRQTDTKQKTNKKNRNRMYTYLGKWIMVNNSKCECPFRPAHPGKSPFLEASWGISPGLLGGSSVRSQTVDWLCLGPAQQRSCIASWGCGPSSRGPDLTIPLCGCHQMVMARCCAPQD